MESAEACVHHGMHTLCIWLTCIQLKHTEQLQRQHSVMKSALKHSLHVDTAISCQLAHQCVGHVANAVSATKFSPALYLKTFTSTFSRPSILSSSFSMDPMRLRAAWENTANLAGVGNQWHLKHADSALEVVPLICSTLPIHSLRALQAGRMCCCFQCCCYSETM